MFDYTSSKEDLIKDYKREIKEAEDSIKELQMEIEEFEERIKYYKDLLTKLEGSEEHDND